MFHPLALSRTGWAGLFAAACLMSAAARSESYLVKEGSPQAVIVLSETPAPMARLAALELQTYVKKITGATLPIVTNPEGRAPVAVYVGTSPHTERLGIDTSGLAHGAYRMASGKDWLVLAGSDKEFKPVEPYAHSRTSGSGGRAERMRIDRAWDQITGETFSNPFHYVWPYWNEELQVWELSDAGTLNAVYDFLRGQGVRWYHPGDIGEVCPKAANIALPQTDKVVRPDFALRDFSYWSKHYAMTPEEDLWNLRMGINHGPEIIGLTQFVHGSKFVHLREEFKQAHPECLALYGGKRAVDHKVTQGAPCLSSEEFFRQHVKYARAIFDHFDEPLISIDPVDGYSRGVCQCPLCTGKGSPERDFRGAMSDYVWGYVNRVAKELYKSHPHKMVSALAYGAYTLPPTNIATFAPNLAVTIQQPRAAFYDQPTRETYRDLRKAWLAKIPSKTLFISGNYWVGAPGGTWDGVPVFYTRLIAEDLRSLKGVSRGDHLGVYQPGNPAELGYDYLAVNHLNLYVTSRLWWDADRDIEMLLDEYCAKYYGPAREQMKTFIDYAEQNWPRMRSEPEAIDKALALIDVARAAAGDSIYGERVELIRTYVDRMKLLRAQIGKAREGVPEARALQRSPNDVTIDGKLDEEKFWNVRRYSLTDLVTGGPVKNPTSFRIAWGGDSLYLGITCKDSDMKGLKIGTEQDDDRRIWDGDVVEIHIETQFHSYYQLAISPSGAITDLDRSKGLGADWDARATVATHRGEDGWTIEVRLPVAGEDAKVNDPLVGIAGRKPTETYPWYINVCRARMREGEKELSAWSPTGEARFNVPAKLGKVWSK